MSVDSGKRRMIRRRTDRVELLSIRNMTLPLRRASSSWIASCASRNASIFPMERDRSIEQRLDAAQLLQAHPRDRLRGRHAESLLPELEGLDDEAPVERDVVEREHRREDVEAPLDPVVVDLDAGAVARHEEVHPLKLLERHPQRRTIDSELGREQALGGQATPGRKLAPEDLAHQRVGEHLGRPAPVLHRSGHWDVLSGSGLTSLIKWIIQFCKR